MKMQMKALTAIAVLAVAGTACAEVASINWKEFAGGVNDVLDGWGVEAANNWNNSQAGTAWNDQGLSSGAASTIDVAVTAPGGFDTWGFAAQNNTAMRAGIAAYANPVTVTLSDINATFSTYDVIVYVGGFLDNTATIDDGSTTYYSKVPNPYTTSLIQSTDTNIGDGADLGTYVRFNGLTADSTTITLSGTGTGIGGIQIVAVPEPATLGLFGIAGVGILFVRRKTSV